MPIGLVQRRFASIIAVCASLLLGCNGGAESEDAVMSEYTPRYHVQVYTESFPGDPDFLATYENDECITLTGSHARPDVVTYLNDSPIFWITAGGLYVKCDAFLQEGVNKVRLSGEREYPMYVKVFTMTPEGAFDEVVAKQLVLPDDDAPLEFRIDDVPAVPLSLEPLAGHEDEIRELAMGFVNACQTCDADIVAEFLVPEGHAKLRGTGYELVAERRKTVSEGITQATSSELTPGEPTSGELVKIQIGKRTALLYYGVESNGMPFVYRWKSADGGVHYPPILVHRNNGEWCFSAL